MPLHRNKKELITSIERSDYLPILGSLLIGFVIARSVWKPGFQQPSYEMHGTAPVLARDLPAISDTGNEAIVGTAHTYGEFQPLIETPPAPETRERNNKLPRPELFVKTTPTKDGYLLSFSTNNFIVGTDGYLLFSKDGETTKIYASPYFIDTKTITKSSKLSIQLVDNDGKIITINTSPITEHLSF